MARVLGLEALHMASADVLPYDYDLYGKEISAYLENSHDKARLVLGGNAPDYSQAEAAAKRFTSAGAKALELENNPPQDLTKLNHALIAAERALLLDQGLPNRPWFRHAIYAPGQYTGYAAVVIPGVNEAIDAHNAQLTAEQLRALTQVLNRAAQVLEGAGQ
jgi:N-acetylated-alpha-linked acidic dipeptidase